MGCRRVAEPHLVVTAAHVVAGAGGLRVDGRPATAWAVDRANDVAVLDVPALSARPLPFSEPHAGEPVAILGYPENGPFDARPGRIGTTARVLLNGRPRTVTVFSEVVAALAVTVEREETYHLATSVSLTFGVPRVGGNYGAGVFGYYQILQAPGNVVLTSEFIHEARIIPLDGRRHLPPSIRQWNGDSRGRWEGNTLVVDTTNFSPQSHFMGSAENLHLVERLTRVAPDTINYEITLDDLTTWTKPWTAIVRLKQSQNQLYEVACHEGNYFTMVGILAGARAEEKAAQETAKQESK